MAIAYGRQRRREKPYIHRRNCRQPVCDECSFIDPFPYGDDEEQKHGRDRDQLHQLLHEISGRDLVLANGDTVYRLDDQEKPAAFAGLKVKVTGTLNAKTKTIHVVDIKAEGNLELRTESMELVFCRFFIRWLSLLLVTAGDPNTINMPISGSMG